MRRLIPLALMFLVGFGCLTYALSLDDALALFQGSDIMVPYSEEGQQQLEEAIDALKEAIGVPDGLAETDEDAVGALAVDPADKDLLNKLSQAYYTLMDAFLQNDPDVTTADVIAMYLKGKNWGMKSLRMNPEFVRIEQQDGFIAAVRAETDVAALYWTNANWLRSISQTKDDKLKAMLIWGVPPKSEAMMFRLLELDDTYNSYGTYRSLGAFWGGMEKLPMGYFRKNLAKSLYYFCKVVDEPQVCAEAECEDCPAYSQFDPAANEYFENRLFFVEYYLMEYLAWKGIEQGGLWEDAKRILADILAEPIGDKHPLYNAISQEKAAEFLEEVEEHL